MEDRFKFRVLNTVYNHLYTDLLCLDEDIIIGILENNPDFKEFKLIQCTGLKDKNGKLIYEGDIVKFIDFLHEESKGTVIFNDRCASFFVEKIVEFYPLTEFVNVNRYDLKILGNIYENPELLESEDICFL